MTDALAIQPQEANPLALLQYAVEKGATIEQLTALMGLAERWQANQAQQAFRDAMSVFSASQPTIEKNKHVKFTSKSGGTVDYHHATLDCVTEQIVKGLSAVGVTHSFRIVQQGDSVTVTCVLSKGAYSEEVSLTAPVDTSGLKNPTQGIVSTVTYLRRHTLLAATGVATGMQDDDGNGGQGLTEAQLNDIALVETAKDIDALQRHFKAAYSTAKGNDELQKRLIAAKDARKAELAKGVSDARP